MIELAYFAAGWAAAISSVALGGYLVFRTKREAYEPFVGLPAKRAEGPINIIDPVDEVPMDIPASVQDSNQTFVDQFMRRLAEKRGADNAA